MASVEPGSSSSSWVCHVAKYFSFGWGFREAVGYSRLIQGRHATYPVLKIHVARDKHREQHRIGGVGMVASGCSESYSWLMKKIVRSKRKSHTQVVLNIFRDVRFVSGDFSDFVIGVKIFYDLYKFFSDSA